MTETDIGARRVFGASGLRSTSWPLCVWGSGCVMWRLAGLLLSHVKGWFKRGQTKQCFTFLRLNTNNTHLLQHRIQLCNIFRYIPFTKMNTDIFRKIHNKLPKITNIMTYQWLAGINHFVVHTCVIKGCVHANLISVFIALHPADGADWQVISEVILAVMGRFDPSTEKEHSLRTRVWPGENALLVHTAQHLWEG